MGGGGQFNEGDMVGEQRALMGAAPLPLFYCFDRGEMRNGNFEGFPKEYLTEMKGKLDPSQRR